MKNRAFIALFLLFWKLSVGGADDICPDIRGAQERDVAVQALGRFRLYECVDMTVADALKMKPVPPIARRLYEYTCKVANGKPSLDKVLDALNRRQKSAMAPPILTADLSQSVPAGAASSPVVLVGYVCSRCPLCKFLTLLLYKDVTEGPLKGKVKFYFRPFPVKSHQHSVEGELAVQAATQLGRSWEYLLLLYRNFETFSVKNLYTWAVDSLNMNQKEFNDARISEQAKEAVTESKKEGFKNGVTETPTFFINGRKYVGFMNYQSLLDMLGEEYDRIQGRSCVE